MEDFDALIVLPVALADAAAGAAFARFRTRTLGAAQQYAAANGYVGLKGRQPALFAAGVSMVDGHPVESAFESWAKYYVGLFAALAVYEAASAAADPNFVRDEAWPLLRAVAEFVVARGEWTARGFEFGLSMNRDEAMPRVTDVSTRARCSGCAFSRWHWNATQPRLPDGWRDEQAAKGWAAVLAVIYVPTDADGVILPFEDAVHNSGTSPHNVSIGTLQQLLAHVVPARLSAATVRATLQAEEDLLRRKWTAAHAADLKGNPATICQGEYMSCPPMAQATALLGYRDMTGILLRKLAMNQTLPPFDIVSEHPCGECGAGHGGCMTNVGSFLSTLYALAGVQAKMSKVGAAWIVRNATLPSGWDSLSFGRVELGGDTFRLEVVHGARATLTPVPEKR